MFFVISKDDNRVECELVIRNMEEDGEKGSISVNVNL